MEDLKNNQSNAQGSDSSAPKSKMTRAQAGKRGGLAPHKCRGRQCNNKPKNPVIGDLNRPIT